MEFFGHLNWIDIFIVSVIVLSALAGLVRGFFREICTIAVWVLSTLGAWFLSKPVGGMLTGWMGEKTYQKIQKIFDNQEYLDLSLRILSAIIIFIILVVILQIAVSVLTTKIRVKSLTTVDKILGAVVGVARGLVFLAVIWYFAQDIMGIAQQQYTTNKAYAQQISQSKTLAPVKITSRIIKPFLDPFVAHFLSQLTKVDPSQTPLNSEEGIMEGEASEDILSDIENSGNIEDIPQSDIGNAQDATERAITPSIGNETDAVIPGLSDAAQREIQDLLTNE